jgi:hypothetical protein
MQIFFVGGEFTSRMITLASCKYHEKALSSFSRKLEAAGVSRPTEISVFRCPGMRELSLGDRKQQVRWACICTLIASEERVARHRSKQEPTSHFHSGEIATRASKLCSSSSERAARDLDIAQSNDRRTGLMLRVQIMRMSEMGNKTGQREMRIQMRGALSLIISLCR